MATFQYKAYTARGAVTAGTIVAEGLDAAIDALYGSGLTPFETYGVADQAAERSSQSSAPSREAETSIWKRELVQSNRFSLKELTAFTVELASLTNSGLTLDAAFRIIAGPGAAPKTARLANGLLKDVLAGLQLSEAMAQRPDVFPSDYRAILAAGEAGGVTGQVLKQIAELLARRLEIRNKISSALVYPLILILMSLVSVVVIVFVLIPSISPIFIDAGLPLPGILHFFEEVQDNWLIVLLAVASLRRSGFRVVGQGEAKSRDHARCRSFEMLGAGDWRVHSKPRSRRLCARARHAARRKSAVDVRDANRAGAGHQSAPECAL